MSDTPKFSWLEIALFHEIGIPPPVSTHFLSIPPHFPAGIPRCAADDGDGGRDESDALARAAVDSGERSESGVHSSAAPPPLPIY